MGKVTINLHFIKLFLSKSAGTRWHVSSVDVLFLNELNWVDSYFIVAYSAVIGRNCQHVFTQHLDEKQTHILGIHCPHVGFSSVSWVVKAILRCMVVAKMREPPKSVLFPKFFGGSIKKRWRTNMGVVFPLPIAENDGAKFGASQRVSKSHPSIHHP